MKLFLCAEAKVPESIAKLYLLKNGEVIVVEDGSVSVLGQTRIIEK